MGTASGTGAEALVTKVGESSGRAADVVAGPLCRSMAVAVSADALAGWKAGVALAVSG